MNDSSTKKHKYLLVSLIIIFSGLILIIGRQYYKHEQKVIQQQKYNELKAIADLKTDQISQWKKERISEVDFFSNNDEIVKQVNLLVKGKLYDKRILYKNLSHILSNNRYENIFILNNKGKVIFNLDSNLFFVDSITVVQSKNVQITNEILFTEFYNCSTHHKVHLDILAPVSLNETVIATMVFRINPADFLYPYIQNWPTPSKSAETLLIKQEGDSVVFLNQLRHVKNTPLKLKVALTETDVAAVKAVLGYDGLFEGIDYRGVDVVSMASKISDTSWYMVAKVDRDEIFAELNARAIFITIVVFLLILFVIVLLIWFYNLRQKNMYKKLLANEIELHESQEEFRATLYSIGDGVITTDKKGLVKQLNPVAEALTGWNEKEAKGKKLETVFTIINEETRKTVVSPVSKVLNEGLVVGLANHTLLISKNGTEVPIADSGAPIKDVKGNITGVVLVFRDQTESRAQQKVLKESEERFQLLFNKAPLGYQSLDFDGNFMDVNQQWLDTLGYARDEVIGKWFGDFLVPEFRDAFRERFPIFKAQGYIHSEFEMLHKNGNRLFIAFEGKIGYNKLGEFIQTHCILQDITDKRKAELALRESEKKLSQHNEILTTLMKNLQIGVFMVEAPSGKPLIVNDAAFNLLGRGIIPNASKGNLGEVYKAYKYGSNELYPPEEMPILLGLSGKSTHVDDIVVERPDGTKTLLDVSGTPIFDTEGKVWASLVSFIDITQRKQAEEKLKESYSLIRIAGEKVKLGGWNVLLNENRSYWSDEVAAIHEMPAGYAPLVSEGINFYAPEWRDRITEVFTRCAQQGIPYDEEMEIITSSGKRVWVRTVGEAVRDENGKIFKVQGAFQDISAQKHIEAQLNERELLFQALMDNSPIYIFFKDRDIKSLHLSKNYEQMLGKPLHELLGKDMFELFPSELAKSMIADDKKIVEEGKLVTIDEFFNDHYYTTIKFPILQENNELLLAGFTIDITERKKIEKEIIKLNEELEQRIKERTQDLENKNDELERMNKLFIGRELRIKELREKIKELENKS
ncbi:MAG: PAS domain S-box protein [Bacteroidales bacterium]